MSVDVATSLFQLVALSVPPIAVLIQMLRKSENLPWVYRQWSFAMALLSVLAFIGTGGITAYYLASAVGLPGLLVAGLGLAIAGLAPFAAFVVILYREHQLAFGP